MQVNNIIKQAISFDDLGAAALVFLWERQLELLFKLCVDGAFLEVDLELFAAERTLDSHASGFSEAAAAEAVTTRELDRLDHDFHADDAVTILYTQLNYFVFGRFHSLII